MTSTPSTDHICELNDAAARTEPQASCGISFAPTSARSENPELFAESIAS